jgi:lipopolysaccharide/colanic/teichoic acid biosynthesis glycosyltransferase
MQKRLFDVILSFLGLLMLFPILIAIAISIKLYSRGPVLFRQLRVGRHGEEFTIYKFRTMIWEPTGRGAQITVGRDRRITKVGHFLRKLKADEIPQFLNVLLGDMSLVGPRPEVMKYVNLYPQKTRDIVLSVRPGITDLASIAFSNESEILKYMIDPEQHYINIILPEKLRYCVKYVEENSFLQDVHIILLTLKKLIS